MVTQRKVQVRSSNGNLMKMCSFYDGLCHKTAYWIAGMKVANMKHVKKYKTMNSGMYAETSSNNAC